MSNQSNKPENTLTPKEFEACALLVRGRTHPQIATILNISRSTVKVHMRSIRTKCGADNMISVAVWFVKKYPTKAKEVAGYKQTILKVHKRLFSGKAFLADMLK